MNRHERHIPLALRAALACMLLLAGIAVLPTVHQAQDNVAPLTQAG